MHYKYIQIDTTKYVLTTVFHINNVHIWILILYTLFTFLIMHQQNRLYIACAFKLNI